MKTLEELGYIRTTNKKDKILYRKKEFETTYITEWKEIEIFKANGKKWVGKSCFEEDRKRRFESIEALNFNQEEIEAIAQIMRDMK